MWCRTALCPCPDRLRGALPGVGLDPRISQPEDCLMPASQDGRGYRGAQACPQGRRRGYRCGVDRRLASQRSGLVGADRCDGHGSSVREQPRRGPIRLRRSKTCSHPGRQGVVVGHRDGVAWSALGAPSNRSNHEFLDQSTAITTASCGPCSSTPLKVETPDPPYATPPVRGQAAGAALEWVIWAVVRRGPSPRSRSLTGRQSS